MAEPKPGGATKRFRVAAYNVENLFARPRVFDKNAVADSGAALAAIAKLQRLLAQKLYDRDGILRLFNEARLFEACVVRCDRVTAEAARSAKFFFHDGADDRRPAASLNDAIRGRDDWAGAIDFREEALSGPQVAALAKVIKRVDADVIVLNEVEDRRTLEAFNAQALGRRYGYAILFEGNDARGIDIGVLSKHPVIALRTNVFTPDPAEPKRRDGTAGRLFERDCLEVSIALPDGKGELAMLATHFKSKRGRDESDTDPKRLAQSAEIARIVAERYAAAGKPRRVIVAGDLNERPDRNGANGARLGAAKTSIDPLLASAGLSNVVGEALKDGAWTYLADGPDGPSRSQIDYLLLSPDLKAAAIAAGIDRSGQPGWGPKAPPRALAASDHAAIWVDLDLAKL